MNGHPLLVLSLALSFHLGSCGRLGSKRPAPTLGDASTDSARPTAPTDSGSMPVPSASSSSSSSAAGWNRDASPTGPISNAQLEALLRESAGKDPKYPPEPLVDFVAGGPKEVDLAGTRMTLVPLLIHFLKESNRYCRLGLVWNDPLRAEICAVPVQADYAECRGLRKLVEGDLNDDGVPDFVLGVTIPSNRYPVDVTEEMVYLSNIRERTFCFAPKLSGDFLNVRDANSYRKIVREAVVRRGVGILDCYRPGAP